MKYITSQENSTSDAWPKSGCKASRITTAIAVRKEYSLPGGPPIVCAAAMNQAQIATKPGFRNSDGCMETPAMDSQRVAPLP